MSMGEGRGKVNESRRHGKPRTLWVDFVRGSSVWQEKLRTEEIGWQARWMSARVFDNRT